MFGASNVYGVSIGANVAETGAEFVVGYKGGDIALIPVSAIQKGGGEEAVGAAKSDTHKDSYSVIGQFDGNAGRSPGGAKAGLGKFFATGTAAQNIAHGFAKQMGVDRTAVAGCRPADKPAATSAEYDKLAKGLAGLEDRQKALENTVIRAAPVRPAHGDVATSGWLAGRSGANLIFAQYDYLALAIDGSVVDQGIKLTLGLRDKNVALVPILGRDAEGNLVHLESLNSGSGQDAFSVLGRFVSRNEILRNAANDGRTVTSGLSSFFSTGAAAEILSGGFKTKLCEEYVAPAQVAK